jgi:DNA-binding NarL/FixJ family response regulator
MTYGRYPAECDLAPLPFLSVGAAARSNCCAAVEPRTLTPVEPEAQTSAAVSEARVRVVVGEDHPLVQAGIVHVLEGAGFDVVGVAGDARDLIQITSVEQPDVVVTDIQMPPTSTDDGLKAAKEIRATWPMIGVVVLSQFLETQYALDLVGAGAARVGYLLKDRLGDLTMFTDSVRRVAAGGSALDPEVVQRMVDRPRERDPIQQLSPREREVLALMAEGYSNHGIARRLTVTVAAVERHVTSIFMKLDLQHTREDHLRILAVLRFLQR